MIATVLTSCLFAAAIASGIYVYYEYRTAPLVDGCEDCDCPLNAYRNPQG